MVEVFHVDTGSSEYVEVSSICAGTPPMLCDIPQQALQCSLSGVEVVSPKSHVTSTVDPRTQTDKLTVIWVCVN